MFNDKMTKFHKNLFADEEERSKGRNTLLAIIILPIVIFIALVLILSFA